MFLDPVTTHTTPYVRAYSPFTIHPILQQSAALLPGRVKLQQLGSADPLDHVRVQYAKLKLFYSSIIDCYTPPEKRTHDLQCVLVVVLWVQGSSYSSIVHDCLFVTSFVSRQLSEVLSIAFLYV